MNVWIDKEIIQFGLVYKNNETNMIIQIVSKIINLILFKIV